MCINFIDVNQLTREAKYIMKDSWQLVGIWEKATLGSLLDMKVYYHNLPVKEGT